MFELHWKVWSPNIDWSSFNLSHLGPFAKTSGAVTHLGDGPQLEDHSSLDFVQRRKQKKRISHFIFSSQLAPGSWNDWQLWKREEVSNSFHTVLHTNQREIHMRDDARQQQGQSAVPDYWQAWWNVTLYCRGGIQVWQEGGEDPPFVRVWRTHAIPHICSISDSICLVR